MNSNNSEYPLNSIPSYWNTVKYLFLTLFVYGVTVIPIFLIYLKVYKRNKSRDQETAVFQIIDHFHGINVKLTIAFWCCISLEVLLYYYKHDFIALTLLAIIAISSMCVTEVNQFLLGLLAIQRFLIYFYPSTEKYLNFSKKTMKWILIIAYSISVLEPILLLKFNPKQESNDSLASVYDNFLVSYVYNLSLQVFLTASALLYIPIIVSISKLTNLASAKINKPQIFVALQLVVVVAKQMIFLTLVLVFENFYLTPVTLATQFNKTVDIPTVSAFCDSKVIDIFLMPPITQITYLLCNRRNVITLWRSLKPTCCKSNAVDPNVALNYMENMETTRQ